MLNFTQYIELNESEARIRVLEQKYGPIFSKALEARFQREPWWNHYSTPAEKAANDEYRHGVLLQSTNRLLGHGVDIDPTREYKYLDWIYRVILKVIKGETMTSYDRIPEDVVTFHEILKQFDELKTKNKIPPQHKDINSFKGFTELSVVVRPLWKAYTAEQVFEITPEGVRAFGHDITTFYKGPLGEIYVPHTEAASRYLGKQTKWCTAYQDSPTWFSRYNKDGPLFVIVDKFGARVQLHIHSEQVMDVQDHVIPAQMFRHSGIWKQLGEQMFNYQLDHHKGSVREFYDMIVMCYDIGSPPPKSIEKRFMDEVSKARVGTGERGYIKAYARSFGLSQEIKKLILDSKSSSLIRDIATSVMFDRWPEGEKVMLATVKPYDYEDLWGYYKDHFKSGERWPEAEKIFATYGTALTFYPTNRVRFPLAEQNLLNRHVKLWENGGYEAAIPARAHYLASYARYKLERRWPEAERMIQESRTAWDDYREHFGLPFDH